VNWDTDEIEAVAISASGRRVFANMSVTQLSDGGSMLELRIYGFRKRVDRLAGNTGRRLRGGSNVARTWRIPRWV
jgi:hypothetical protein